MLGIIEDGHAIRREKALKQAESVFLMQYKLQEKYEGWSGLWSITDNPIPWIHNVHGVLFSQDIGPALFQEIITAMQEEYADVKPESYAAVKKKLTQNEMWNEVKTTNFLGKTDEEIILQYIADSIRLCEKCTAVIRKIEKLIDSS